MELGRRESFGNQGIIEGTRAGNIPRNWSPDSTTMAFVDWQNIDGTLLAQLMMFSGSNGLESARFLGGDSLNDHLTART